LARLTPIHYNKSESFLIKVGCEFVRQEGDHLIYKRANLSRPLIIPVETELPMFIIRNNLRALGIKRDEYLKILEEL